MLAAPLGARAVRSDAGRGGGRRGRGERDRDGGAGARPGREGRTGRRRSSMPWRARRAYPLWELLGAGGERRGPRRRAPSGRPSSETDVTIAHRVRPRDGRAGRGVGGPRVPRAQGEGQQGRRRRCCRALLAVARAGLRPPGSRVDANAGYRAAEAIALARECERLGIAVEVLGAAVRGRRPGGDGRGGGRAGGPWSSPTSRSRASPTSSASSGARCADGVNLKLRQVGGLLVAPSPSAGRARRPGSASWSAVWWRRAWG